MGQFKGNLGNLMQHWVLCETLEAAATLGRSDLLFLCTHSMAPWSTLEPRPKGTTHFHRFFDLARERLFHEAVKGRPLPAYERAWSELSPAQGLPYPSSAVFATNRWPGNLSLWLCEAVEKIAGEISEWWNRPDFGRQLLGKRIYEDCWQKCFRDPPELLFERARACNLAVVELDPDMVISQAGTQRENPRIVYNEDLALILFLLRRFDMPVIVQLSSYSPNYGNTPEAIEAVVSPAFRASGFVLQGQVCAQNSMTSMVYARDVTLWDRDPKCLSGCFDRWLPAV